MKTIFSILVLAGISYGQATIKGHQAVVGGSGSVFIFVANSITVSPPNIGAIVGSNVSFTATFLDNSGNTTPACVSSGWASSAPGIATINASTGVASAVSAGSTTISCTASGLVGNALLVVETVPNFTNPVTPCTQPCILLGGTVGQLYSNTLAASGATPPYTFSLTAGSLPSGLSLVTSGVISGTPVSAGSSVFTVQVCDSLGACSSLQMSITISSAGSCTTTGPPTYTCASTSTADTTVPLTALFTSTAPTPTTCSGQCQNSTADDTQLPGHIAGTYKYTRISDGLTLNGKSVTNFTPSGGDNDRTFSYPEGKFLYFVTGLGTILVELTVSGGAFQVVNAGAGAPIIRGTGFSTSWTTETRFYHFAAGAAPSYIAQGDLTGLVGGHVVNGTTSFTDTTLFDFFAAGHCPGGSHGPSFAPSWHSDIGVSKDDDTFTVSLGPAGGQGHSDTTFSYSKTKGIGGGPGCAVINFATGQVWRWDTCVPGSCTGLEPPTFTFSDVAAQCWGSRGSLGWGIHNSQGTGDGNFVAVSRQNPSTGWTKGGCAVTGGGGGPVMVNLSTGQNQYCDTAAYSCGGHNSEGISKDLHTYWATGMNIRALSDVTMPTTFYVIPPIQDEHCSWPHNNNGAYDDTLPWLCASDSSAVENGGIYTPKYLNNEIWVVDPTLTTSQVAKRFGHTFGCNAGVGAVCADGIQDGFGPGNAIGMARPKADGFCYASSMLHQMGHDSAGAPRADAFCIYMGN